MSQHDYTIANDTRTNVRADIQDAFQAAASTNKGPSAPGTPYAGQIWVDDNTPSSTVWTVNMYDGSDWIALGTLDTTSNTFTPTGISNPLPALGSALQLLGVDPAGTAFEYRDGESKIAADGAPSSAASFSFSSISSVINETRLSIRSLIPATNSASLHLTLLDSGNSEIVSSVYASQGVTYYSDGVSAVNISSGNTPIAYIPLTYVDVYNDAVLGGIAGEVRLFDMQSARHKRLTWDLQYGQSVGQLSVHSIGSAIVQTTSVIKGFKLAFSSGNIASGALALFGSR